MRLFFAVQLPEGLIGRIAAVQTELAGRLTDSGVRWTKTEQLHFTVKFLGDTPAEKIERVIQAGNAVREENPSFELAIGGLGGFPSSNRPSVLWLGASKGAENLRNLALQLDEILVKYGYRAEKRPLTPHLTLARIKTYSGEAETTRLLKAHEVGDIGSTMIDRFVLMRSTLKPTGSEYNVVEEYMLK
jgi:2'-5' RNA ligase